LASGVAHDGFHTMSEIKGPWAVTTKRIEYDNRWIRVMNHDVISPADETGVYGAVHFKNWAIGIVPVDEEGFTYLVGQY
jgi:ADP-ribose pyrophosphatase